MKLAGASKDTSLPLKEAEISLPVEILKVKPFPSISLPDKLALPVSSSSKVTLDTLDKTGASFTGCTVIVMISVSESSLSLTVMVNDSLPLKSCTGIKVRSLPERFAVI